jgi:hypothetical protein
LHAAPALTGRQNRLCSQHACMARLCLDFRPAAFGLRKQRKRHFKSRARAMPCGELQREIAFQEQIRDGLQARQTKKLTPDDIGAAVLTLGYNAAHNGYMRHERDTRIDTLNRRLSLLSTLKTEEGCPT